MNRVDNAVMIILTAQKSVVKKLEKISEALNSDGSLGFLDAELDMVEKAVCSLYDKKYSDELADAFMDYNNNKKDILDIIDMLNN